MDIRALNQLEDAGQLKALVHEYLDHELIQLKALSGLAFETGDLVADTFDHIGDYLPPNGALHVAADRTGALVGCVFLRMIRPDAGEIKRLYVRPAARGTGLGRRLMDSILTAARDRGARSILLDTGVYDTAAHGLYRKLGFRDIPRYPEGESDPRVVPHLLFMQLDLA